MFTSSIRWTEGAETSDSLEIFLNTFPVLPPVWQKNQNIVLFLNLEKRRKRSELVHTAYILVNVQKTLN